jgi:CDP-diacylglycerol--serine O-phosphatidyltransferase
MMDDDPRIGDETDPGDDPEIGPSKPGFARMTLMQGTAVLPSFVTMLNGIAGLAAIHFATKGAYGQFDGGHMACLRTASWLIVLAMVFDMLDGRLARMTRRTSDFGAQLDSLCDAISFGVAPAILMVHLSVPSLRALGVLGLDWRIERLVWLVASIYVACAVLRLARFNVETEADESAHMTFRGLPTPGAAASVASVVLLIERLTTVDALVGNWQQSRPFLMVMSIVPIIVAGGTAVLMVSSFEYMHLVNQYIRGKRPFSYLVKLLFVGVLLVWQPFATAAIGTNVYALSGPARSVWIRLRPGGRDGKRKAKS